MAEAEAAPVAGFGARLLTRGGFIGPVGVLDGVGGETEGEAAARCQLLQERGVVAYGVVLAVGAGPSCLFDQVVPVRFVRGEDEQLGAVGIVRVEPPQGAFPFGRAGDTSLDRPRPRKSLLPGHLRDGHLPCLPPRAGHNGSSSGPRSAATLRAAPQCPCSGAPRPTTGRSGPARPQPHPDCTPTPVILQPVPRRSSHQQQRDTRDQAAPTESRTTEPKRNNVPYKASNWLNFA